MGFYLFNYYFCTTRILYIFFRTPTIDGAENGSAWPSFNSQKQIILHINTSGSNVIQNPFVENYVFWNNLPLLSNIKIMVKGVPTSVHKKHEL